MRFGASLLVPLSADVWPCALWSLVRQQCRSRVPPNGVFGRGRFGAWALVPLQRAAVRCPLQGAAAKCVAVCAWSLLRGVSGRVRFGAWVLALLEGAAECRCVILILQCVFCSPNRTH